jgi:hypothetical protein
MANSHFSNPQVDKLQLFDTFPLPVLIKTYAFVDQLHTEFINKINPRTKSGRLIFPANRYRPIFLRPVVVLKYNQGHIKISF